jgi:hypothetical protein
MFLLSPAICTTLITCVFAVLWSMCTLSIYFQQQNAFVTWSINQATGQHLHNTVVLPSVIPYSLLACLGRSLTSDFPRLCLKEERTSLLSDTYSLQHWGEQGASSLLIMVHKSCVVFVLPSTALVRFLNQRRGEAFIFVSCSPSSMIPTLIVLVAHYGLNSSCLSAFTTSLDAAAPMLLKTRHACLIVCL